MKSKSDTSIIGAGLLVAATGLAVAGDMVPIKGTVNSPATHVVGVNPDGSINAYADFTGIVSHLGAITARDSYRAHFAVVDGRPSLVGPCWLDITAPDGDQLTAAGHFTTFVDVSPWRTHAHILITGGTGRFVGATGATDYDATEDTTTTAIEASLEGVISTVGSSH